MPTKHTHSHRLFVSLPLFCLVGVCSLLGGIQLQGTALQPADIWNVQGGVVRSNVQPQEAEGAVLLHDAALLARADGLVHVAYEDTHAWLWNGVAAFYPAADGGLTIAAVDAPVLLSRGAMRVVIPAQTQWKLEHAKDSSLVQGRRSMLPAHARADILEKLPLPTTQPVGRESTMSYTAPLDFLRLPAAKKRYQDAVDVRAVQAVQTALEQADDSVLRMQLASPEVQSALQGPMGQAALPLLLQLAAKQGKAPLLLPFFLTSADRWLLAAFHPQVRRYAVLMPLPTDVLHEHVRALAGSIILSDMLEDPFHERSLAEAIQRVRDAWDGATQEERSTYLLPAWIRQLGRMGDAQLADRLRRHGEHLLRIVEGDTQATAAIQAVLEEKEKNVLRTDDAHFVQQESVAIPVEAEVHDRTQEARDLLQRNGMMFTRKSTVEMSRAGVVDVADVVLATHSGDMLFSFALQIDEKAVSQIRMGEQILPLGMPLQDFLLWARSGAR